MAGLGAIDVLVFALTLHTSLTYHRKPGGPLVMPLGELLGWIVFGVLSVLLLVILKESRH